MAIGGLVAATLTVGGCANAVSGLMGLAESGTLEDAIIASATVDALTAQGIGILVMPVCDGSGPEDADYTCTGKTIKGETITTTVTDGASSNPTPHMTITVGNRTVYKGEIETVLNNSMVVK